MIKINFIVTDASGNVLLYETLINFITSFFEIGGSLWSVLGVIRLASSMHERSGPGIQSALWQIVGGVALILSAILYRTLNFDFAMIVQILFYAAKLVVFAGALWCLYGVINLAVSLTNTNAPTLEASLWQIVGGIFICIAGFLLNNIVVIIN